MDLTDSESIELLPIYYELMKSDLSLANKKIPVNKDLPKDEHHDLIFRELDCAVIEYMHQKVDEQIKSDVRKRDIVNINILIQQEEFSQKEAPFLKEQEFNQKITYRFV